MSALLFPQPQPIPTGLTTPVSVTLPQVVKRIARELHPQKIILFGSYAYGTPTVDSDVDLLVVMDTDARPKERAWAVSRLLIPRPFPVDILVKTPKELEIALAKGDFFLCDLLARGKVLYERHK